MLYYSSKTHPHSRLFKEHAGKTCQIFIDDLGIKKTFIMHESGLSLISDDSVPDLIIETTLSKLLNFIRSKQGISFRGDQKFGIALKRLLSDMPQITQTLLADKLPYPVYSLLQVCTETTKSCGTAFTQMCHSIQYGLCHELAITPTNTECKKQHEAICELIFKIDNLEQQMSKEICLEEPED